MSGLSFSSASVQATLLAAISFYPSGSFAFEVSASSTGAPLQRTPGLWPAGLHGSESASVAQTIRLSFDVWGLAANGELRPEWRGPQDSDPGDNIDTVSFDHQWDPAFGDPSLAVAFADVRFDPRTGTIRSSDIHLNAEVFGFGDEPGQFDLQSVVVHELGHSLGLAHSCGDPGSRYPSCFSLPPEQVDALLSAVMAPALAVGEARRALNIDDRAGLAQVLPNAAVDAPSRLDVMLACPESELRWSAAVSVELRTYAGRTEVATPSLKLQEVPDFSEFVHRNPSTGAYAVTVLEVQEGCAANPEPPEAEGGCQATPMSASLLFALLGVLAVRWRQQA